MKTLMTVAIAATTLAIPGAALAQRTPAAAVAVVNTQRIYTDCTACKSAVTQLQTQQTAARTRAQTLQTQLQTESTSLQTSVNALNGKEPDAALKARITAFQTRQNSANQEIANLERNLQSTQVNVRQQIDARLGPIFNQVMTDRGANLLVDDEATLAHAGALEVTTDVLNRLNTALPSVSVTPLPQQTQTRPQGR